jgi:hypothetical protein
MSLRWSLVVLIVGCVGASCQKKADPAPAASASGAVPAKRAEVEFVGQWARNGVEVASVEFVAQKEPCVPVPTKATTLGTHPFTGAEGRFLAEFFVEQGTVGHACLYGKDAQGVIVAAAAYAKNPVTMQGEGEVVIGPMTLALSKLP